MVRADPGPLRGPRITRTRREDNRAGKTIRGRRPCRLLVTLTAKSVFAALHGLNGLPCVSEGAFLCLAGSRSGLARQVLRALAIPWPVASTWAAHSGEGSGTRPA
jgi:hypothetical protein